MPITNEILSEVLGKEVVYMPDNTSLNPDRNQIVYFIKPKNFKFGDTVRARSINKYEFIHKCKEYIFDGKYWIQQRTTRDVSYIDILSEKSKAKMPMVACLGDGKIGDFEVTIKATQWVIDNKEK